MCDMSEVSNTRTVNFQLFKLVLEKAEEPRDQIANIRWIIKKAREFQKNIYFCFIYYAKAFVWITTNWRIFSDGHTRPPYLCPEKALCRSRSNR